NGMKEIQVFGKEKDFFQEVKDTNDKVVSAQRGLVHHNALFFPSMDFLSQFATMIFLAGGSYLILQDELKIGSLAAMLAYLASLNHPVRELTEKWSIVLVSFVSAERLRNLIELELPNEKQYFGESPNPSSVIASGPLSIEFKNVTLSYGVEN